MDADTRAPAPESGPSLEAFLRANRHRILARWEERARTLPSARALAGPQLLDSMPELFDALVGIAAPDADSVAAELAEHHAYVRFEEGFDVRELVDEYAALRSVILAAWREAGGNSPEALARIDEALDQALAAAIDRYAHVRERTSLAFERVVAAALDSRNVRAFLPKLLRAFAEATPAADSVAIFLREGERLVLRAAIGLEPDVDRGLSLAIGEGFAGQVAQRREPVLYSAANGELSGVSEALRRRGTRVVYGVPLLLGEALLGVAQVGSRTAKDFTEEDKRVFRAMAQRATQLIAHHEVRAGLEKEREDFVNILVHDLKTPLSTIRGMAQLAHAQLERAGDARLGERMVKIERQVLRMSRLLNDLLDARLLTDGRLPVEPAPLAYRPLLAELAEEWRAASVDHPIAVEAEDVWVLADRARLIQILNNLVGNAIKYSPHGGEVKVVVRAKGDEVLTSVRDSGVGIAQAEFERIFEPYTRSRHPRTKGHGLGLFIASELVHSHKGRIWLESEPGKGSTFFFTLPASGGPS